MAGELLGHLTYSTRWSQPRPAALHGGALGALLESTAIFSSVGRDHRPAKTISITIEYRARPPLDTWAKAR